MKKWLCVPIVILLSICLVSCRKNISPKSTVYELANSVKFNSQTGILSFTTPKKIPVGYDLWLHVSGRLQMGDSGMSFHAFEDAEQNRNWELGKTYTYEVGVDALLEGLVDIGLIEKDGEQIQNHMYIVIDENGVATTVSD